MMTVPLVLVIQLVVSCMRVSMLFLCFFCSFVCVLCILAIVHFSIVVIIAIGYSFYFSKCVCCWKRTMTGTPETVREICCCLLHSCISVLDKHTHTHTYAHTYIYMYIYICTWNELGVVSACLLWSMQAFLQLACMRKLIGCSFRNSLPHSGNNLCGNVKLAPVFAFTYWLLDNTL